MKDIEDLNNIVNQLELIGMYRTLYKQLHFSDTHESIHQDRPLAGP